MLQLLWVVDILVTCTDFRSFSSTLWKLWKSWQFTVHYTTTALTCLTPRVIRNTSVPNAQPDSKGMCHWNHRLSTVPSLLRYTKGTDVQLSLHVWRPCLLALPKEGDRNHLPPWSNNDASSTAGKLLPVPTWAVTLVFLHRVTGWKSSRRSGFSVQDPVQGDTISSCSLGSQDLPFKSTAAERELE